MNNESLCRLSYKRSRNTLSTLESKDVVYYSVGFPPGTMRPALPVSRWVNPSQALQRTGHPMAHGSMDHIAHPPHPSRVRPPVQTRLNATTRCVQRSDSAMPQLASKDFPCLCGCSEMWFIDGCGTAVGGWRRGNHPVAETGEVGAILEGTERIAPQSPPVNSLVRALVLRSPSLAPPIDPVGAGR